MVDKLDLYEGLLRQIAPQLDAELQSTVNQALVKVCLYRPPTLQV
jgi:hypothetical protein